MGSNQSQPQEFTGNVTRKRKRDTAGQWERQFTYDDYVGPQNDPPPAKGVLTYDPNVGFAGALHVPHDHIIVGSGTTGIPTTVHKSTLSGNGIPLAYRINVNPMSNLDPNVMGLIINSSQTHPSTYKLPITTEIEGLGMAGSVVNDPNNVLTLGPDSITVNADCTVYASMEIFALSNTTDASNFYICQLLLNGQAVFTGPPGLNAGSDFRIDLTPTAVGALYTKAGAASSSGILSLHAGDVVSIVVYLQSDSMTLTVTGGISIAFLTQQVNAGDGGISTLNEGPGLSFSTNPIVNTGTIGLSTTGVTAGVYTTPNLTVDQYGRITAVSATTPGTVSSVSAGTGMNFSTITNTGTINLGDTSVTPGNYIAASFTVDQQGRITAASSNTLTSGTVTSVSAGTGMNFSTITGSGTVTMADTAVTPGSYTAPTLTVDQQGRITSASSNTLTTGTVTSVAAGTGMNFSTITGSGTVALGNTTVTPGSYTAANITVDAQGRITSASNGSGGGTVYHMTVSRNTDITSGTTGQGAYFIPFNQTIANTGFTTGDNITYTATNAGTYMFTVCVSVFGPGYGAFQADNLQLALIINGSVNPLYISSTPIANGVSVVHSNASCVKALAASDTFKLQVTLQGQASNNVVIYSDGSQFSFPRLSVTKIG